MRRRISTFIFRAAFLLALSVAAGGSSQKSSGVAGGGRVSRANDAAATPETRRGSGNSNDEESALRHTGRRIREMESLERQCLDEVNRVRGARKLAQLEFFDELLSVAREYSRRMAEEHFFSHDDPDGKTVRERVDNAEIKWRMLGENLAYSNGYVNPVAASVHGWMDSPGHRRNILEPDFKLTAIGVWITNDGTVYFTEIFLKQ